MTVLLALDPSVRSPGAAVFRNNVLVAAGKVKLPVMLASLPEGMRWQRVAEAIIEWAYSAGSCYRPEKIVYERPQIYTASKSKGDPNDLIALAAIGAAVCSWYVAKPPINQAIVIETPTPAQWAGQIPKATKGSAKDSPRAKRILSRLSPIELAQAPNQHDALDAIGLGLHALGRLGIRRSYTNSL